MHIPTFVYYFIYNITSIKKYISNELKKFNYASHNSNPNKKRDKKSKDKKSHDERKKLIKNNDLHIYAKRNKHRTKLKDNISSTFNLNNNLSSDKMNNLKSISIKSKDKLIIKEKDKNDKKRKRKNKKDNKNPPLLFNFKVMNKNYINIIKNKDKNKNKEKINDKRKNKDKENKNFETKNPNKIAKPPKIKFSSKTYYLIQMDANNTTSIIPPNSNMILDNYQYETAIKHDKRNFFRIFYICILTKENIINFILFRTPMNLKILHFSFFLFLFSCDLAFNSIFYSNKNISDKYHYEGDNVYFLQ